MSADDIEGEAGSYGLELRPQVPRLCVAVLVRREVIVKTGLECRRACRCISSTGETYVQTVIACDRSGDSDHCARQRQEGGRIRTVLIEVGAEHVQHGAALRIRDRVEAVKRRRKFLGNIFGVLARGEGVVQLSDFGRIGNGLRDRVGRLQSVHTQRPLNPEIRTAMFACEDQRRVLDDPSIGTGPTYSTL